MYFLLDNAKTKVKLREHFYKYNAELKLSDSTNYKSLCLKSAYLSTANSLIDVFEEYLKQNKIGVVELNRPFNIVLNGIANQMISHRTTTYRHIKHLEMAGIVVHKSNLGNHQGVIIRLNPDLLVTYLREEEEEKEAIQQDVFAEGVNDINGYRAF